MTEIRRHFLDINTLKANELKKIIASSRAMKSSRNGIHRAQGPLAGKALAMIFDRPSTRTRVSFDLAMRELGGETVMLTGAEMQLGRGETIADTARVLSRYVDIIMIRTLEHEALLELAQYASIPVINGLTRQSHPCQIMADIMTFEEHKGSITNRRITWLGASNNVLMSWVHAAKLFSFELRIAAPNELLVDTQFIDEERSAGAHITITNDPHEAVHNADCIITDTWVSMGDKEREWRHNLLMPYQVNEHLMSKAAEDAIFMHCLPAHRGEEVTGDIIDGPQSVVFDEAENRLHAQKGILAWCFGKIAGEENE